MKKKISTIQNTTVKKTVIVKIGGALNVIDGSINKPLVQSICKQVKMIANRFNVVLTISGAIPIGFSGSQTSIELISKERKSLYSMIGQPDLVSAYKSELKRHKIISGQGLYTTDSLKKPFACKVLGEAFYSNIVVLANENDAVDPEEISGDNDLLAAKIAVLTKADYLIILSSLIGISSSDIILNAIKTGDITEEFIHSIDNHSTSRPGSNGIGPKLSATKFAFDNGVNNVIIANGNEPNVIPRIIIGEQIGTKIIK